MAELRRVVGTKPGVDDCCVSARDNATVAAENALASL